MSRFWCSKCDNMYWGRGIEYNNGLYCTSCYKQIRYKEVEQEIKQALGGA